MYIYIKCVSIKIHITKDKATWRFFTMDIDNKLLLDIATDRRLSSLDVRVWLYFLSKNNECDFRQEQVADELNVTRENLNRSISKLKAFGYITTSADREYYKKYIYNMDTGNREYLVRKARIQDVIYSAEINVLMNFSLRNVMELINIDVKSKTDKLLIEDDYKNEGTIFYNSKLDEYKDELTDVEKKDNDWMSFTKVRILERNYYNQLVNLIKLYEERYQKQILEKFEYDYVISIENIIFIIGLIDTFKKDIDKSIYLPIKNFKEKFLDFTIEQYLKIGALSEDFLIKYNIANKDFIRKRVINRDYLMAVLGFKNRDTTHSRNKFKRFMNKLNYDCDAEYYFEDVVEIFKDLDEIKEDEVDFAIRDGVFNLSFNQFKKIYNLEN